MRRWTGTTVAVCVAALVLVGCGNDGPDDDAVLVVGVLQAVASGPPGNLIDELETAGFVEGENLTILGAGEDEAYPDPESAARAVRGWARDRLDLVLAFSTTGAQAAKEAAPDTTVLFLLNDPKAVGLVADEDRPEGRLTGVTFRVPADRTIALAHRVIPDLTTLGFLAPEADPAAAPHQAAVETAADEAGVTVVARTFSSEDDVGASLEALVEGGVQAVLVANAPTAVRAIGTIQDEADARGIALVANTDLADQAVLVVTPDAGALLAQMGRQAARLLAGADVRDVPVEDPRAFLVVVNVARAEALGLPAVPEDVIRQADRVIE
jgi:putative ABC transport system substrate-binding protein